jgi:hypothetical protein
MFLAVVEVQAGDYIGNPVYVGCFSSRLHRNHVRKDANVINASQAEEASG